MSVAASSKPETVAFVDEWAPPGTVYGGPRAKLGPSGGYRCPKCKARVDGGYGYGFGAGVGSYMVCRKNCGWFYKRVDPE